MIHIDFTLPAGAFSGPGQCHVFSRKAKHDAITDLDGSSTAEIVARTVRHCQSVRHCQFKSTPNQVNRLL